MTKTKKNPWKDDIGITKRNPENKTDWKEDEIGLHFFPGPVKGIYTLEKKKKRMRA